MGHVTNFDPLVCCSRVNFMLLMLTDPRKISLDCNYCPRMYVPKFITRSYKVYNEIPSAWQKIKKVLKITCK